MNRAQAAELRALWEVPELHPLWTAARRRLERNGWVLTGGPLVLPDPDLATRDRVAALLGELRRPAGDLRVSLARLDAALRATRFGVGLVEVLETLDGRPLANRPAERAAARGARDEALRALLDHRALAARPELAAWARRLDARALLPQQSGRPAPAVTALEVLACLPAEGIGLAELAQQAAGGAHRLDADTPLARLVLAGVAVLLGAGTPSDAAGRRELWDAAGVVVNPLTAHVLVLNLPLGGPGAIAGRLREAAAAGVAERLLLSQLRREPPDATPLAGRRVRVCENPVVVERAEARLGAGSAPLVCVEGWPNGAAARLLGALHRAGARLGYHGDFDWAGVRIAASVMGRFGAAPWRLGAGDYRTAVAGRDGLPALAGHPAPTPWDPELAEAMGSVGRLLEEEAVLEELLGDLAS